jgi:hypothetical protein
MIEYAEFVVPEKYEDETRGTELIRSQGVEVERVEQSMFMKRIGKTLWRFKTGTQVINAPAARWVDAVKFYLYATLYVKHEGR